MSLQSAADPDHLAKFAHSPPSMNLLFYKLKGRNASLESYSIKLADTNRLMACRQPTTTSTS